MIAVDTSALVAILLGEIERTDYLAILDSADGIFVSTGTLIEARMVIHGRGGPPLVQKLDSLCRDYQMKMVSPGDEEVQYAQHAFTTYGKGSGHPAQLNFGDLFAYALAKARDIPLLFKGTNFSKTDIGRLDWQQPE
jgi:ribonuclease VapC